MRYEVRALRYGPRGGWVPDKLLWVGEDYREAVAVAMNHASRFDPGVIVLLREEDGFYEILLEVPR
jgi:hypothetical protein